MNLETYAVEARKTQVFNPEHSLYYPVLGLCDEVAEFIEKDTLFYPQINSKDLVLEAGDVMWYFSCVCDYANMPITNFFTHEASTTPVELFITCGKIAGVIKKQLRDGTINTGKLGDLLELLSAQFLNILYQTLPDYTLEEILDMNIAKLRDRQMRNVIHGDGDNR